MADGPLKELLSNIEMNGTPGAASAIKDTLGSLPQNKAQSGDLSAIKEMFSGSDTSPQSSVIQNLAGDLTSSLKIKLGISSDQAMSLAKTALPMLMNFSTRK